MVETSLNLCFQTRNPLRPTTKRPPSVAPTAMPATAPVDSVAGSVGVGSLELVGTGTLEAVDVAFEDIDVDEGAVVVDVDEAGSETLK